MSFEENELGFEFSTEQFLVFFGKQAAQFRQVQKKYPYLDLASIEQTHGDQFVECTEPKVDYKKADAHWTRLQKTALVIKTADCIPLMGFHLKTGTTLAVHAGWRGVANCISQKLLASLKIEHDPTAWRFFIGPHIQKKSFEVQSDSLDLLQATTTLDGSLWSEKTASGWLVDLNPILNQQLLEIGVDSNQLHWLNLDTKSDLRFHSHRRDRELAGRQLSFIARL